ncbi:RHS repeat-associated core domain-containing protein [Pseudoalteromonas rubra]|uniref:RHS repeat-associated core domain-containing protein n=1 Tax=Pseudoalteromonas rubra TaxID=43658 RepID=UPI000F786E97|nr:RHS repeat-associated core domain-containing protein [Pseudoalteromonas rubra]
MSKRFIIVVWMLLFCETAFAAVSVPEELMRRQTEYCLGAGDTFVMPKGQQFPTEVTFNIYKKSMGADYARVELTNHTTKQVSNFSILPTVASYTGTISELGYYSLRVEYLYTENNKSLKGKWGGEVSGGLYVETAVCRPQIGVVEETPPEVTLESTSAQGKTVTLKATATDDGRDIESLKICLIESQERCDPVISCTSDAQGRCSGFNDRGQVTATLSYEQQYGQRLTFRATATDKYGVSSSSEHQTEVITEDNTSSAVSLTLYNMDGQPLENDVMLSGEQDIIAVAHVQDQDETSANWPSSATLKVNANNVALLNRTNSLTLSTGSLNAQCFKSGNETVNRSDTYCYRQVRISSTTRFKALAGGGESNEIAINVATRPNLTNVSLRDDVVLPGTSLKLAFSVVDDSQAVSKDRISVCYMPRAASSATLTSCEGATSVSSALVQGQNNTYTAEFSVPQPGRYHLLVLVNDNSGLADAQARSSLTFSTIQSAGVALHVPNPDDLNPSEGLQRMRGTAFEEEILVGALSSEPGYLCRVALFSEEAGGEIASAVVEQALPNLEDDNNSLVAKLTWSPSSYLPKNLNVKARAYLRQGSVCSASTERAFDSVESYSFTLNSEEPKNPRVILTHDGIASPGVIKITLARRDADHANQYELYEFVGTADQAWDHDLTNWHRAGPSLSADNVPLQQFVTKPPVDHNKRAVYCAVATNEDHTGPKTYSTSYCAQTTIHNQGDAPPPAYFDNDDYYFGPYTLNIESASNYASQADLALYFKLERKLAGNSDWEVLNQQLEARPYSASAPEAQYAITRPAANQTVTYRVTAFNRNGAQSVQSAQSTFSVQHVNAKIVSVVPGSGEREYVVTGVAFAPQGNIVSVQQNTTGVSHQLGAADVTYIDSTRLRVKVPEPIEQAYTQGGFVVGIKNALTNASYSTYNVDGTSGDVADPLNYTPTVGFNGQQYLGKGNALYAEKDLQTQWFRETGGQLSSRPIVTQSGIGSDVVFAGSQDHHIYAWSQIGTQLWKTATRGAVEAEGLVVGDDQLSGQLFYGSADGALYVLNATTGAIDYLYQLGAKVSQKPMVVGNQIWAVTEDGQLHKLDRHAAGLQPLRWGDMDNSPLLDAFTQAFPAGWTPGEDVEALYSLLRLGYLVLGRDLTRHELSFLAYAVIHHNVTLLEVADAMLASTEGQQRFAPSLDETQFYDQLINLTYHLSANGLAGYDRAYWINRLKTDLSRSQFLLEVQWSSGYAVTYNQAVVSTLYYYYGHCYKDALCNDWVDSDGDNVSDVAETVLGTNKLDPRDGLLSAPDLTLTPEGAGRIKAEFSYGRDLARFKLVDVASNTAPTSHAAENRQAEAVLVYPNGSHRFYAQACIDVAVNAANPNNTTEFCSTPSAEQTITVLDSLAQGQITPHSPPLATASFEAASSSALDTHYKYSFTAGSFRVNEQGAATYSIPIALPQGIAGVTPEVSLNYNSQQPASSVAQGWQLSAGSAITRCRQTLAQDGAFKPVSIGLDNEDRYCLDGQRLILINNAEHGKVGAEYRTEIDSQQRIEIEPGEESYKVQFVVYGKDGSKRIYGGTDNSQAGGEQYPSSWLIRQSMDSVAAAGAATEPAANVIQYRYRHGGLAGRPDSALGQLETVLSSINYSGYTVTFNYQAGPVRNLAYSLEAVSQPMQAQAELTDIRVSKGQTPLHYYELQTERGANGVRQLKQVRHCDRPVSDGDATCKQPVTFDYEQTKTYPEMSASQDLLGVGMHEKIVATSILDSNGNGEPELAALIQLQDTYQHELCLIKRDGTTQCQVIDTYNREDSVSMMPFDREGDGTQGLLIQTKKPLHGADVSIQWTYFVFDKTPWQSSSITGSGSMKALRIGDANGDGFDDLMYTNTTAYQQPRLVLNGDISLGYHQDIQRNLENDAPFYFMDMDFDGKADLVTSTCAKDGCREPGKYDYVFVFYNRYDPANLKHKFEVGTYSSQPVVHSSLTPMDINGDGTLDLMYQNQDDDWEVVLGRPAHGEGLFFDRDAITTLTPPDNVNITREVAIWAPLLADLNGDGQTELYVTGKSTTGPREFGLYRYEFEPGTRTFNTPTEVAYRLDQTPTSGAMVFFADMDGDGTPELVAQNHHQITQYGRTYQQFGAGRLSTITQGMGNQTRIYYGDMSDPAVYRKGDEAVSAQMQADSDLKVTDLAAGASLVREVQTSALDTQTGDTTLSVTYEYEGARVQFGGRGWLGFSALTTNTTKDGLHIATRTEYEQVFPLTGMPKRTTKTLYVDGRAQVLSDAYDDYAEVAKPGLTGTFYQVYNQKSRTCSARVNTDKYWADGYDCSQTTTTQDDYGNVTKMVVAKYPHDQSTLGDLVLQEPVTVVSGVTTSNYYGTPEEQALGRLRDAVVIHARAGQGYISRTSHFTYKQSGALAGLLETEIVEPNGACDAYLKTTNGYDDFGNLISKRVQSKDGCSDSINRTSTTTYDSEGRYVVSQHNGIFTSAQVISRNKYGQVTEARNADGVSQYTYYDAFGGEIGSHSPSGAQQRTLMTDCLIGAPAYCAFASATYVNTELVARTYFDRLGRVLAKARLTPKGQWLQDTTHYDKFGRAVVVTPAGHASTHTYYDVLDRVIQVDDHQLDLTTTQRVEDRTLTAQVTATNGSDIPGGAQTTITTHNVHGEKHTVTDQTGQVLTYSYNRLGLLETVKSSAEGNTALITNTYNLITGRKERTEDVDRGNWQYTYNALGELLTQTDANGDKQSFVYDDLGRKTQLNINDAVDSQWHYHPSQPWRLDSEQRGSWVRSYLYDPLGRQVASVTDLESALSCKDEVSYEPATKDVRITDALASVHDAKCVVQLTTFDEYGRVFQQFDDYRRTRDRGRFVEARGQRLYYSAGQVYQKQEAREGDAGQLYYVAESEDSAGRVIGYKKGHFSMVVGYDSRGNLKTLGVDEHSAYSHIQQHSYTFDALGNLTSRALTAAETATTFGYDALNRVTTVNGEVRYGYDANGDLTSKDGWTQKYGKAGEPLHAIYERVKGSQTETFRYDANGNQTGATVLLNGMSQERTLTYSARNKVTQISQNGEVINFEYDANNRRYKRTEGSKTIYYVGALEIVDEGASGEFANQHYVRRSINGDAVQTYHPNGQASLQWLFTDHQGSVVAITDYAGKFLKRFSYDVFGKQSEIVRPPSSDTSYTQWSTATMGIFTRVPANSRSYTGHEPITLGGDNRIIHMNGRIYDADTGRFMQADPFVQAPSNLQNYNAYSYVLNNPLSYTDPSGYLFNKLGSLYKKYWQGTIGNALRAISKVPVLNAAAQIGIGIVCGPGAPACLGAYNAAQTYAVTGDFGAALKNGAISAASAYAFQQIGKHFKAKFGIKPGSNLSFADLELGQQLQWAGSHALVGGVTSVLSGGKFGHGFIAAGFTKMAMGNAGFNMNNRAWTAIAGRTAVAAIVGGTASAITGGKFSNGARTAAMMHLLNAEGRGAFEAKQQRRTLAITKEQRRFAKLEMRKEFWESRAIAGDKLAKAALNIVNDEGFFERITNIRLRNHLQYFHSGTPDITEHDVGVAIMNAHIEAVDFDFNNNIGEIPGGLSYMQIDIYHYKVFDQLNIDRFIYGGSVVPGPISNLLYCNGCDAAGVRIE